MLVLGVPMACLFIAFVMTFLTLFDRIGNPKPFYSEFPNALRILESKMNWVHSSNGPSIFITGILTNESPAGWKDVEFDCRFFDSSGRLVDAASRRSYSTVAANDDIAFRVAIEPTAPTNRYATFRIGVGSARNAKSWF